MNNPEQHHKNPNQETTNSDLQAELLEIARQNREQSGTVKSDTKLDEEPLENTTTPEGEVNEEEINEEEVAEIAEKEQPLSEDEKYLSDLVHHMKSQQPNIYKDTLDRIVSERNVDSSEPVDAGELDRELEERISKQGNIPADLLAEMANEMRAEDVDASSQAWKEVNANGLIGDVARRWRDMYRKAMNEILR